MNTPPQGFIRVEFTRTSIFSGITRTKAMFVKPQDLVDHGERTKNIQNCFPYLSPDEREFIMTGITKEEWETLPFGSGRVDFFEK